MKRPIPLFGLATTMLLAGCGGGDTTAMMDGGDTPDAGTPQRPAFLSCSQTSPLGLFNPALLPPGEAPQRRDAQATGGVRLSGVISVSEGTAVDVDVNDPSAITEPPIHNNFFGKAQNIGNPVTLGGYLNAAGNGEPGNSFAFGDLSDFYRAALISGQRVTLNVADAQAGDLDLCLFDARGNLVDASVNVGTLESVLVPADGSYFIEVYVFQGYSNYVLALGQDVGPAADPLTLKSRFVIGETRMQWRQAGTDTAARRRSAAALGLAQGDGLPGRWELLRLPQAGDADSRRSALAVLGVTQQVAGPEHPASRAGLAAEWDTLMAIKSLRQRNDVAFAEPNYLWQPLAVPNDTHYPLQWHYPLIELPQAWDLLPGQLREPAPVVAVVDTGIVSAHPDLQGPIIDGFDFISSAVAAADGDGRDLDPEDPGDQSPGGSSFHGTHVAGTIAAASNNGTGVAGVTWRTNTRVMPLRALGVGGGTSADVDAALLYAAGLEPPTAQRRADIVNLSLGGPGISTTSRQVLDQVIDAGVIVIAAAGNDSSSAPSFPAAHPPVISVSAVGPDQTLAYYSNFGATIDIAAPGGDNSRDRDGDGYPDGVLSTSANDSDGTVRSVYTFANGTSMAAPHVAGVAALMKAVRPELTPAEFQSLLDQGALTDDIGAAGRDDLYGQGLINARKAVQAALGNLEPAAARLLALSTAINFGSTQSQALLRLRNGGGQALALTGLEIDQSWLTAAPLPDELVLAPNEQISLALSADRNALRSTLGPGSYQARISVESAVNTVTVTALIEIGVLGGSGDNAGFHYVLLIDPDASNPDESVVAQDAVAVAGGRYAFSFESVLPGNYQIVAGTDLDNDGFICDAGEACGAYLSLDQPVTFAVGAEALDNLDFVSGYDAILQLQAASAGGRPFTGYPILRRAAP